MNALQALCAHYGVAYKAGKPHKHAAPLSKAASNGNFRITFSNLTEVLEDPDAEMSTAKCRGDIWVEARWGGCWRWATSAYDHDLWDVFSVLIEGAENAGRLEGMADADAEMFAPTPIPEALVSAFQ